MYIASSSRSVKFHSFPEGNLVYNYQPGSKIEGPIRSISWSKDGSWLAVVPQLGCPEIISVKNQLKLIHTITDVEDAVSIAFQNSTRKFIALGTGSGEALIYDVKQKKIKHKLYPSAQSGVSHMEFTARDSHLVVGCISGEVNVFSNLTCSRSCTMRIPKSKTISALRTNPLKRNIIVAGSHEGAVVVWDTNMNKKKFFTEAHNGSVMGVAFSPSNPDLIISTGADRQFLCHDVVSDKCIATVPVHSCMSCVDFAPDGTHFALGSFNGKISLYDSRRILEPVLVFEAHNKPIDLIAFQKQDRTDLNSSILEEDPVDVKLSRNEEDKSVNESFGNLLAISPRVGEVAEVDSAVSTSKSAFSSKAALDSFFTELGMKCTSRELSRAERSKNGDGDNSPSNTSFNKHLTDNNKSNNQRLSLYNRRSLSIKQASTSTPTCPEVVLSNLGNAVSPIVKATSKDELTSNKTVTPMITPEHLEKKIEEIVERKLTEKLNVLSQDIKYQFSATNSQMRKMHLDIMMSNMKDFIHLEESIKVLRMDIASNSPLSENYLLEENLRLKKQIALLEEKLSKTDLDE